MGGLVLGRKTNEKIYIGDDIVITVVETRYDKVRLHIEAPKGVRVDREEVRLRIKRQQVAEAATDVRGLAGADAEMDFYQSPQDDQPLQQKMEDERENHRD